MINWKVRAKQKWFWLALIPAMIVLIQAVAGSDRHGGEAGSCH